MLVSVAFAFVFVHATVGEELKSRCQRAAAVALTLHYGSEVSTPHLGVVIVHVTFCIRCTSYTHNLSRPASKVAALALGTSLSTISVCPHSVRHSVRPNAANVQDAFAVSYRAFSRRIFATLTCHVFVLVFQHAWCTEFARVLLCRCSGVFGGSCFLSGMATL